MGGLIQGDEISVIIWVNGDPKQMHAECAIRYATSWDNAQTWERLEAVYEKCRAHWMYN